MDSAGLDHASHQIGGLAGQEVQFAQKPPGAVPGDHRLGFVAGGRADDLDPPRLDQDQVVVDVAGAEHDVAQLDRLRHTVGRHAVELGRAQLREGRRGPRPRRRSGRLRRLTVAIRHDLPHR